tara:strand:+ start:306 stop:407 length:102 start_codon:yes stop_codon:yes gene_type:complete
MLGKEGGRSAAITVVLAKYDSWIDGGEYSYDDL